jgi:hypothetical protein
MPNKIHPYDAYFLITENMSSKTLPDGMIEVDGSIHQVTTAVPPLRREEFLAVCQERGIPCQTK